MKMIAFVMVASFMVACSSATEGRGEPLPATCKRTDRTGTYRLTWTEQSGTCGPIEAELVSLNPAEDGKPAGTAGCTLHSAVWSEGDCKSEVAATCVTRIADPTQYGGYGSVTNDAVAVTRQTTANGSRIEGTFSVRLQNSDGQSCQGVYGAVYERQ